MSTPSTTLSARLDASLKSEVIKRAAELGLSPSNYLKRLVEEDLGVAAGSKHVPAVEAKFDPKVGRDLLLGIVRSFGSHRMHDCEYNQKGICTFWYYTPEETKEDAESGLEFVKRGERLRAKVSPELCGLCGWYLIEPLGKDLNRMKHAVKITLAKMGTEVSCGRCGNSGKLVYSDKQRVWVCPDCGEEPF